ncbi:MAG: ROK family glucokinase [Lachnospiraceae bacterium]|nr:ROK family glucokinase [Lachnospiraceae bacterium]MBP5254813.1 ROK family glucokinase [Lachnospiraceae bacterium]
MQEYVAGVDVGGTTIKIAIFPKYERAVCSFSIPTRHGADQFLLWGDIRDAIFEKLKQLGLEREQLTAIGMGLPGPITEDGYCSKLVNIGIGACYPAKELQELSGVPCICANDANVAALGEVTYGVAKGHESAAMITLGTGVGGGIINRGRIISGRHGVGGELGHMVVNPLEKLPCNCGNRGCLEQYASATGIVRSARTILKETTIPSKLRAEERLTAKGVVDAAKEGDPVGLQALEVFGKYLGLAISHIIHTTDPDIIILGGGVSKAGQILLDVVKNYVAQLTHITDKYGDIVLAELGNDAGTYGAAALTYTII